MGSPVLSLCTLVLVAAAVTARTCNIGSSSSISCPGTYDTSDEYYCCGSSGSQYCCDYDDYYDYDYGYVSYVNYGTIIGGVFTGIFFLVIIIVFAVCCCVAACPLYQMRNRGGLVNTGPAAGTVVMASTNMPATQQVAQTYPTGQMAPSPNYDAQPVNYQGYQPTPPGYGGPPPPAHGGPPPQQNAMYPPPTTTNPPPPPAGDSAYPPKY